MTRYTRWLSLVVMVAAMMLGPTGALAQNFPSQQEGSQPGSGGFPSQGGTATQPGGRGGVFQSQDFGFTLAWGAEWTLVEQGGGPGAGFEGVSLENGASFVTVMGVATTDVPQDIVMNIASSATPPMTFDVLVFDEPDRAAAYFATDDPTVAVFIDALTIDSQSALAVLWAFPTAQYDAQFEAFMALMAGLS